MIIVLMADILITGVTFLALNSDRRLFWTFSLYTVSATAVCKDGFPSNSGFSIREMFVIGRLKSAAIWPGGRGAYLVTGSALAPH